MDIEETLGRLQVARDRCPSPVDRQALTEAIEAIEYLQNVLERMDEWIDTYAYDSKGFKF